jgi:transcriptional regulator with XRE-family HTH domain
MTEHHHTESTCVDKELNLSYARNRMSEFGTRIRDARRERGLSLRALAERIGVNFTYLSKIEAGEMDPPSEEKILAIARELEVESDELFILAQKMPDELTRAALQTHVPQILRMVKGLSEDEKLKLLKRLEKQASKAGDLF